MGSPKHLKVPEIHQAYHHRRGEGRTQAVIDAIQAHIAVIDRRGEIVSVNRAWKAFARANGDPHLKHAGIGVNYLRVLADAVTIDNGVRKVYDGISSVLQGLCEIFTVEYPCHTSTAERWFKMVASPLHHNAGGVVLAHYDITDLHVAQCEREALITELSARNAMLEEKQAILQQELAYLGHHANDHKTQITSYLYGAGPLRDLAPEAYRQLIVAYTDLLSRAFEMRAYRIHSDLSASLQMIAERVGTLNGGPRDIVDLHGEVLKDQLPNVRGPKAQALTDEARLLLVKLLSYLAAYYRRFAVGQ